MKRITGSKQRLAGALDPASRQILALTMVEDVLAALCAAPSLAGIAVVTADPAVARLAQRYGARVIPEASERGHSEAVAAAGEALRRSGCSGMLALPGDIPLVTPAEIEAVLAAHGPAPYFTIVPSHDQLGSNAVLASPPGVVKLRFGDDSYRPHLAAAQSAGVPCQSLVLPGIGLDIDHPADVDAFLAVATVTRTERLLRTLGWRG